MANRFWIGTTDADYAKTANWSTSSGGAGGASVPISTDDVFFDAGSVGNACTLDSSRSVDDIDFTGYTGTFNGNTFLWTFFGNCILENLATFTDVDLDFVGLSKLFTSDNSTIDNLTVTNSGPTGHTLTIAADVLNLNGALTIVANSTGDSTVTLSANNPDANINTIVGTKPSSGQPTIIMGSGTWTVTGNGWDMTNITATANTSTLIFTVTAIFTWDDGGDTFHNVIINYAGGSNITFDSTSGTTITLSGKFEIHVTGTGNLESDFLSYICPDGFITEESSTGLYRLDGTTQITVITSRQGTGTNQMDLRGMSTLLVVTMNVGDADYTIFPGGTTINFLGFFSTLLTTTTRTITVSLDSIIVNNQWDANFTADDLCDPMAIIFSNCAYTGNFGSFQEIFTKNAVTAFTLDMGNKDWNFSINDNGVTGHGTFLPLLTTLTGTTGTTTFTVADKPVTDFDLTTKLNNVVIERGTGTRTITFASGQPQTVNGSLTIKTSIIVAASVTIDYNTAQDFEIKGAFAMSVSGGVGNIELKMGTGNWKFGGNVTIQSTAQVTLTAETSTVIFNGTATQTITLTGNQLNVVKNENTALATIIFNDAVDFQSLFSDADTLDRSIQFKNGVTHQINVITFTGTGAFVTFIRSTVLGSTFTLDTNAGQSVDHVDIRDSTASPDTIDATDNSNIESGNVVGWIFGVVKPATQNIETSQIVTAVGKIIPVTVSHIAEFVSAPSVIKQLNLTLSHTLEFTQVLSSGGSVFNVTLSHILEFLQGPVFEPDLVCAPDSTIIRDEVVFWFPFTTMINELILPTPEIGDDHAIHTRVVVRHTRGGTRRAYNQGPVFETFSFTFTGLNRTKRDQIIAFVKLSRSDTVRFLDHENRSWKGIITVSPVVLSSTGRSSPTDEDYSLALSFEGEQL